MIETSFCRNCGCSLLYDEELNKELCEGCAPESGIRDDADAPPLDEVITASRKKPRFVDYAEDYTNHDE